MPVCCDLACQFAASVKKWVAQRVTTCQMSYIIVAHAAAAATAGVANIIAAIKQHAPQLAATIKPQLSAFTAETILPMKTEKDLEVWEKLDDVIMVSHPETM